MMKIVRFALSVFAGSMVFASWAIADCAKLMEARFADIEIKSAEPVASGAFTPPGYPSISAAIRNLPAFCRAVGMIRPTADSEIGFELWLPDQWNGRYLQTGNRGFAGSINYAGLVQSLGHGFAVASTDGGHSGPGAAWALSHPEKVIDYGYRAVHLTSVGAKTIVSAYYSRKPSHAYFSGCSNGGREGLMEAQRYPDDFDGWIIGAPGNNWTGHMAQYLNLSQIAASLKEPITKSQIEALSKAAVARCDAADGIDDGVIDEPLRCKFDPGKQLCKGTLDGKCLSEIQVEAVRKIYDDVRNPVTHESLAPGYQGVLGTEADQWPSLLLGPVAASDARSLAQLFSENFWPYMVYDDPKLNFRDLNLHQAVVDARARLGMLLNSVDPDLSAVRASGKKIIQYHGWADALISAQYSIAYYESVAKYLGRDNRDFYRLFMVPGMAHCGGGPGPNVFGAAYVSGGIFDPEHNALAALMHWVERGQAPERIVATKFEDNDPAKSAVRTRPLCVYPSVAQWTGRGTTDKASNFVCSTRSSTGVAHEKARGFP